MTRKTVVNPQPDDDREPLSPFAFAGRLRGFVEKNRISVTNHLSAIKKRGGEDKLAEDVLPLLLKAEDLIEGSMRRQIARHRVWLEWGQYVKGCGLMTLSAIMSRVNINQINKEGKPSMETLSSMWAHFGFAPGQRRTKGEKVTYDAVGRSWCWRMGASLVRQSGRFKAVYDERKEYEIACAEAHGMKIVPAVKGKTPKANEITQLHIHNRALRYMIKVFLACLYLKWREVEGLPVRCPYIEEHPGSDGLIHKDTYRPEEMIG